MKLKEAFMVFAQIYAEENDIPYIFGDDGSISKTIALEIFDEWLDSYKIDKSKWSRWFRWIPTGIVKIVIKVMARDWFDDLERKM